jgi:hypothetical protein
VKPALAFGLAVLAGCSFAGGDYRGTEYHCGSGEGCPDGFQCADGVCIAHDAAGVADATPVRQPDSATSTECPDNALSNPSFEAGTAGWGGVGGPLTQVSEAHEGNHAAQRCFDGSETYYNINDNPDSVMGTEVGRHYTASAWLRSGSDQTVNAVIRVKDPFGDAIEYSTTAIALKPDWREVTVEHTIEEPEAAAVEVYFANSAPAEGDCFQLDHVCFRRTR